MRAKPCLSCVESGIMKHPARPWQTTPASKHDKGCRDDSAYRNKSIRWVKLMRKLLYDRPESMDVLRNAPTGEAT